ncbi:hypothetical protein PRUPE_7G268400 [Prunus persica]|uniref:PREDICTED: 50S ribosomal L2 n=2 Tax=Prunus TaxID=3754 RepID=A0A5E4F5D1_PRUDU|nr:uncharacterized protein LOC18771152 [Prunus persica]XP_034223733.1 60S ribosomal protein L2, mitochondrial-like [Prunus dulcis]ONH98841.1 hypothetical protein PRUPE_7G268400 [Prunus persica]VVA22339.1 PREDICTED: 50S ribosomal L2 [Prunus dulcis]
MAVWRARAASSTLFNRLLGGHFNAISTTTACRTLSTDVGGTSNQFFHYDINSQFGRCMPLADMHIHAKIHSIEVHPGQGSKLVRAPGTCAKILKEPTSRCLVRLPSGVEKWIDSKCQATIGTVPSEGNKPKKLYKAGQSRWLGRRPTVRGVAMNPVDHPHGGGEGKSKSSGSRGKGSRTPWGKPTKGGYKTGPNKRRK